MIRNVSKLLLPKMRRLPWKEMFITTTKQIPSMYFLNPSLPINTISKRYINQTNQLDAKQSWRRLRGSDQMYPNVEMPLKDAIMEGKPLSVSEWKELQTTTINDIKHINDFNFGGIVMRHCTSLRKFPVAKSFMDYLSACDKEPTLLTLGLFMKLCSLCPEESNETQILNTYESILKQTSVFDTNMSENVIMGICTTSKWHIAVYELFPTLSKQFVLTNATYSALINACFKHNEFEKGFELLEDLSKMQKKPSEAVYDTYLEKCKKEKNAEERWDMFNKLLYYWSDNEVYLHEPLVGKFKFFVENELSDNWCGTYTKVTNKGFCQHCNTLLPSIEVSREDMEKLKAAFLKHVLKGKNIFYNTTEEELEEYQKFVSKTSPYDIVIDGLNVAYLVPNVTSVKAQANMVLTVVNHFHKQGKRLLLLGRKHMLKWPAMDLIMKKCKVFFPQNLSEDDPFLLYAALYSGLGTHVVSRDLMRNHLYLMKAEPGVGDIFQRWLQIYRIRIQYVDSNGIVRVKAPLKHMVIPHLTDTSLHIPYDDGTERFSYEYPTTWLCFQKTKMLQQTNANRINTQKQIR